LGKRAVRSGGEFAVPLWCCFFVLFCVLFLSFCRVCFLSLTFH
jgi:hypothetical protein